MTSRATKCRTNHRMTPRAVLWSIALVIGMAGAGPATAAQPAAAPPATDDQGFPIIDPAELLKPFETPAYTNIVRSELAGPKKSRYDKEPGAPEHEESEPGEYGPPPPGDERIVGEPVPDWTPAMNSPRGSGLLWEFVGPKPIRDEYWSGIDLASGRVVSLAPHPTNQNICYAASASGGIWKTTDGGVTWMPKSDELASLNHGAVALDPRFPNTVYAGTGEYTTGTSGAGLFKSTNGGESWSQVATAAIVGSRISGIIVDPLDSNIIHVTGSRGYVRTTDGGSTWTLGISGACSSLAINPTNPQIVYVAREGDGVFRSANGGQTFTRRMNGVNPNDIRRIVIAIAPSAPATLYMAIVNANAGLQGFYRTSDEGANWAARPNTPDFPYPQGWYDVFVGVSPDNQNTVFCGGVDPRYAPAGVVRTLDGGNTWTEISGAGSSQLHPDHHAIAFGPGNTIWTGNDGGIWKSTSNGNSWINLNATLEITQNYQVALNPADADNMMTGTQDNGTIERFADVVEWAQTVAGDGGFLAYDANQPDRRYTTYVFLNTFRFDNSGFDDITGPWNAEPRRFIAPLAMDPNDSRILMGGTNRVWRTTDADAPGSTPDGGPTWTAISDNLFPGGGTLNAIAAAPGDSSVIYAGGSLGKLYVTRDAGGEWTDISPGLTTNTINDIIIDPASPATAYIALPNTQSIPRVLRTTDYGASWTDVSGDLPVGVAGRALEVDFASEPDRLFMGSGAGIYVSNDGGVSWQKDGDEFPNVQVGDLRIDPVRGIIVAATYGRGVWRAPLRCPADLSGPDDVPDGQVDLTDFFAFFNAFDASDLRADINRDGSVDLVDFFAFLNSFASGC